MDAEYTKYVAFILEAATEKVFYLNLLKYFCDKHINAELVRMNEDGEIFYLVKQQSRKILIKIYSVGTITQITNSGTWFTNRCQKKHKGDWTIFLCYDTDNYQADISKFYEGDWRLLRKELEHSGKNKVIDLAANADIEDIMLLDSEGVYRFLGLDPQPIPTGNKGKSKMKKIFRMKGSGSAYHEGERAKPLIEALDTEKIVNNSPIPFKEIEKAIFE